MQISLSWLLIVIILLCFIGVYLLKIKPCPLMVKDQRRESKH
jgi:hypothetical protein